MGNVWRMAVLALALGAAAPAYADQGLATGVGAALGGLLGSQFGHGGGQLAYTGLGVFTGAMIGNSVGASMDRANSPYVGGGYGYAPRYQSSYSYEPNYVALPAPPPPRVVYVQPQYYAPAPQVVEVREAPVYVDGDYLDGDQPRYCREFTQHVRMNGRLQETYGTACLQPDGSWRVER